MLESGTRGRGGTNKRHTGRTLGQVEGRVSPRDPWQVSGVEGLVEVSHRTGGTQSHIGSVTVLGGVKYRVGDFV